MSLRRKAVQERHRCYTAELSSWGQYGISRCSPPNLQTHSGQVRFVAGSSSYCRRIREYAPPGIETPRRLQRFRLEPSGLAAVGESRSGTALLFLASWYGDPTLTPPPQRLTAPRWECQKPRPVEQHHQQSQNLSKKLRLLRSPDVPRRPCDR